MKYLKLLSIFIGTTILNSCRDKIEYNNLLFFERILLPQQDTVGEIYLLKYIKDSLNDTKIILNSDSVFIIQSLSNKGNKYVYKRIHNNTNIRSNNYIIENYSINIKDTVTVTYIQSKGNHIILDFCEPFRHQRVFMAHKLFEIKQ